VGQHGAPANAPANTVVSSFWDTNNVWIPLNDGTAQRVAYNDGLHPWRNQYMPGIRQWVLDASLFKTITFRERLNIRFNADFFNVLNHPGNPNSVGGDGVLSVRNMARRRANCSSAFGWLGRLLAVMPLAPMQFTNGSNVGRAAGCVTRTLASQSRTPWVLVVRRDFALGILTS